MPGLNFLNSIINLMNTTGIATGLIADRPVKGAPFQWYCATDEQKIYWYVAGAWVLIIDGSPGVAGLTGAINGLSVDGSDAILGGNMDRNVFIKRAGNRFSIGNDVGGAEDGGQLIINDISTLLGVADALTGVGTYWSMFPDVMSWILSTATNDSMGLKLVAGKTTWTVSDLVAGVSTPFVTFDDTQAVFRYLANGVTSLLGVNGTGTLIPIAGNTSQLLFGVKNNISFITDGVLTAFVINHTLGAIPSQVHLSATNTLAGNRKAFSITAMTSTTFTVTYNPAPATSAGVPVTWSALVIA